MSNDPLAFLDSSPSVSQEDPLDFLSTPTQEPVAPQKPSIFDSFGQGLVYQMQSGGAAGAPSLTPEQAKEVAKETTVQAAIGGTSGLLGKAFRPLYQIASKSPYGARALQFVGRLFQAGGTGAAAPLERSVITGEELPTAKEMAKEGALWAGIDLALQGAGGGFSFLKSINKLAKENNLSRTQTIKRVWEGAKRYYKWGEPKIDPKTRTKIITPEQIEAMENLAQKNPEVLMGEVVSVDKEAPSPKGLTFKTAKGSTYSVEKDGSTVRDKAARPEHPGEVGIQPKSEKTFYVTPEQAEALSEIQTEGGKKARIAELKDGSLGIQYLEGKDKGKFEKRTVVKPEKTPKDGYIPLELWRDGRSFHFGNPITEISQDPLAFLEEKPVAKPVPKVDFDNLGSVQNRIKELQKELDEVKSKKIIRDAEKNKIKKLQSAIEGLQGIEKELKETGKVSYLEPSESESAESLLKERYPDVHLSVPENEDRVTLLTMMVPEAKQGQGIGSEIIEDLIDYAQSSEKELYVHPTTDTMAFYKKLGFKDTPKEKEAFGKLYYPKAVAKQAKVAEKAVSSRVDAKTLAQAGALYMPPSEIRRSLKRQFPDLDENKIDFYSGKRTEDPYSIVVVSPKSGKKVYGEGKSWVEAVGILAEKLDKESVQPKPQLTPQQIQFRKIAQAEQKKAEARAEKELQERKEQAEKERLIAFRSIGIKDPKEAIKAAEETVLEPNEDAEALKEDEDELLSDSDPVRAQAFAESLLKRDKVSQKLNGLFKNTDVEYPFKKAGAPKTGRAVKVFHDTINAYLEEAKGLISQLKELKLSKDDLWESFLASESGKQLPTPEMNKARDLFRKYFDTSFDKYKEAGGLTLPWPQSAINRLEQEIIDLKTKLTAPNIRKQAEGKINKEIEQIRKTIRSLKTLKYIPKSASLITQALAETLDSIQPKYMQKYAIAAHRKRTTGALADWIEKEPTIKEVLHPYDFIGDYAAKKGKDLALLKVIKNAIDEGLASKGGRLGFKMDPFKFPALAGYNVHPALFEYITNLTNPIPFNTYDKISRFFKSSILFDPTYLGTLIPYFRTLIQHPKYLARLPKYWKKAVTDFLDKTPAYVEFVEQGGASNPYPETTDFRDWLEKEKLDKGSLAQMLGNWVLSKEGLKDLMNKMAQFSWIIDRLARMAYYNMLTDKGFSSSDAAKLAAENFIDYSKLPAKTRRWLGRLFFAPTSQMLSIINDFVLSISPIRLVQDLIKNKENFKNDRINKERVGLLAGTYLVLAALGALYKSFGFKEEEFGTKYVSPEYEAENGRMTESVVSPTHPLNYSLRWINTFMRGLEPGSDSPIQKLWGRMKNQIGPVPSLVKELGENRDRNGKKIWDPVGDDAIDASLKIIKHVLQKAEPFVLQKFWSPEEKRESKEKVKELIGWAEWFLDGIEFIYERKSESLRKKGRVTYLRREMKKLQKSGELTEEAQERYNKAIESLLD